MPEADQQRLSYDELASLVAAQAETIVKLEAKNAELVSELTELKRRLGMDSSNSSRPRHRMGWPSQSGRQGPRVVNGASRSGRLV